jgi:hypothetical protein
MGGIAASIFRRYCSTLARVFYENKKESRALRSASCFITRLFAVLGLGKLLVELVDTAISSDGSLFASVEWVAVGAGINLNLLEGGTGLEGRAAGSAGDGRSVVSWMDVFFHVQYSFRRALISTESVRSKTH